VVPGATHLVSLAQPSRFTAVLDTVAGRLAGAGADDPGVEDPGAGVASDPIS